MAKVRMPTNEGEDYVYEVEISPFQHEAFQREWKKIRKDMDFSPLEFPFEEFIGVEIINNRYRDFSQPGHEKEDEELVLRILRENPDASKREILEKVRIEEQKMIDEIIKEFEQKDG